MGASSTRPSRFDLTIIDYQYSRSKDDDYANRSIARNWFLLLSSHANPIASPSTYLVYPAVFTNARTLLRVMTCSTQSAVRRKSGHLRRTREK